MRWQAASVCLIQMAQAVLSHDRSRLQAMPQSRFSSGSNTPRWFQLSATTPAEIESELKTRIFSKSEEDTNSENNDIIQVATRSDIPEIQKCNRATLPENYNDAFFESHLSDWPDMSFVAKSEGAVLGYVLGRLEYEDRQKFSSSSRNFISSTEFRTKKKCGHITSLAVSEQYRRRGLARKLMHAVHESMIHNYHVHRARLHVRCSNHDALRLYARLGYTIHSVVKGYYADGESAYLMAADLGINSFTQNKEKEPYSTPDPLHSDHEVPQNIDRFVLPAKPQHVVISATGGEANTKNPLHFR
mmetsp:Transcript_18549/g.24110  ORF Transcript_18549/g.24110 Transcript_18549/m.24110 type:complete len:302 (+) Transcript_18549:175-1080(+)